MSKKHMGDMDNDDTRYHFLLPEDLDSPFLDNSDNDDDGDNDGDNDFEAQRYRQDTAERKILSRWVRYVVSIWLGLTVLILILNRPLCLKLDETVLCTLLATTTVNILGLAFIVLKGLFPNDKK